MKEFFITLIGFLLMLAFGLAFLFCIVYILGMCWEYSLNTWLEYAESPNRVELWQCMLISLVPAIGQSSFIVAIITWIAMLFLK